MGLRQREALTAKFRHRCRAPIGARLAIRITIAPNRDAACAVGETNPLSSPTMTLLAVPHGR